MRLRATALAAALLFAPLAPAQEAVPRTYQVENGPAVEYMVRAFAADAHLQQPAKELTRSSALDTAKLLNLHLTLGEIEEAAMLSNAPKRRFEVLKDYREMVGDEEFKRVFAQYFYPENRLVAEVAIDNHRLLLWELQTQKPPARPVLAAQYFVAVDGRYMIDDVPNDTRTRLRWVLEGYRAGKIPR